MLTPRYVPGSVRKCFKMGHLMSYEVNNILILILQLRKLGLKGILELAPNHPAGKWCGQDLAQSF